MKAAQASPHSSPQLHLIVDRIAATFSDSALWTTGTSDESGIWQ
jgi:hypothetical protein